MTTIYSKPEQFGLTTVGEVDYSDGDYEFDLTVVWKRADGVFVYADDSGCSCPGPFDDSTIESLTPVRTFAELREHLTGRHQPSKYRPDRTADIARLLDLARGAGLR